MQEGLLADYNAKTEELRLAAYLANFKYEPGLAKKLLSEVTNIPVRELLTFLKKDQDVLLHYDNITIVERFLKLFK